MVIWLLCFEGFLLGYFGITSRTSFYCSFLIFCCVLFQLDLFLIWYLFFGKSVSSSIVLLCFRLNVSLALDLNVLDLKIGNC